MSIKEHIKNLLEKIIPCRTAHEHLTQQLEFCRNDLDQLRYTLFAMRYSRPETSGRYFHRCLLLNCCSSPLFGINLGDYVQAIAVRHAVSRLMSGVHFVPYERDYLSHYTGKPAFTIMQGWFGTDADYFPSGDIHPVYIGMHITENRRTQFLNFLRCNPTYFDGHDVGCRDMDTVLFMRKLGINAYLSRCLTLTLPKRERAPENGKVFIVNVPDDILHLVPDSLKKDAVFINQRQRQEYGNKSEELVPLFERFMDDASALLERYKTEARLVITAAIHCASPCTAMGIPTILIDSCGEKDRRLGFLKGILPVYSREEIVQGGILWEKCEAPDITPLQDRMLLNLRLSILKERGEDVDEDLLQSARAYIASFQTS